MANASLGLGLFVLTAEALNDLHRTLTNSTQAFLKHVIWNFEEICNPDSTQRGQAIKGSNFLFLFIFSECVVAAFVHAKAVQCKAFPKTHTLLLLLFLPVCCRKPAPIQPQIRLINKPIWSHPWVHHWLSTVNPKHSFWMSADRKTQPERLIKCQRWVPFWRTVFNLSPFALKLSCTVNMKSSSIQGDCPEHKTPCGQFEKLFGIEPGNDNVISCLFSLVMRGYCPSNAIHHLSSQWRVVLFVSPFWISLNKPKHACIKCLSPEHASWQGFLCQY